MSTAVVLPVLIPLATAVLLLLTGQRWKGRRATALGGAVALLAASVWLLLRVRAAGVQVAQIGGWPAPFGITLAADRFSALMAVLASGLGLLVIVFSLGSIDRRREEFGYYAVLHLVLTGVSGAVLTGDLFNLFVWFEVMLIASFVLLVLGGTRAQIEGAVKYVALNLISSVLLLVAIGILYGLAGTLNMADLAWKLDATGSPGLLTVVAMLFLVAFGIKAAVFPLFAWLPASYPTPPAPVTALFAGLLTKVGVYALVRTFTLLFVHDIAYTHTAVLVIAGLTMITGVLGAVAQSEMRRLLSFHIVSQIGYLLMGLGIFTPAALLGTVVFMVHIVIAKSALFLVAGIVHRLRGTYRLDRLGGLYRDHPALSGLFLVPALSLAGVPPFSGFFAKLILIAAGLSAGRYIIVAIALVVSVLTLYSMAKIWTNAFWHPAREEESAADIRPTSPLLWAPVAVMAALMAALGLAAEPMSAFALAAAQELLHPVEYIDTILGGAR